MKALAAAFAVHLLLMGNGSCIPAGDNPITATIEKINISLHLPEMWERSGNSAFDTHVLPSTDIVGGVRAKRFELISGLTEEPISSSAWYDTLPPQETTGVLMDGTEYIHFASHSTITDAIPSARVRRDVYNFYLASKDAYFSMVFYTYPDIDPADYFATTVEPFIDTLRLSGHTAAPVPENRITTTVDRTRDNPDDPIRLTFDLPATWKYEGITAGDLEAIAAGRYCTKRLEVFPFLIDEPFRCYESSLPPTESAGILSDGTEYLRYAALGPTEIGTTVWRYAYNFYLPEEDAYLTMVFNTYPEDDPADYFETNIEPILDTVVIE